MHNLTKNSVAGQCSPLSKPYFIDYVSSNLYLLRLEHPNRVLTQLFEKLEQLDVISAESFLQWKKDEEPANLPGKGVCVNSTTQFFVWLQENTEEDDEDNEEKDEE